MRTGGPLLKFSIDKFTPDGFVAEYQIEPTTGQALLTHLSARNIHTGYVLREELDLIADGPMKDDIVKFTESIENLHGYTIETPDHSNETHNLRVADAQYYARMKKVACGFAMAVLNLYEDSRALPINLTSPTGEILVKNYDSDGRYILLDWEKLVVKSLSKVVGAPYDSVMEFLDHGSSTNYCVSPPVSDAIFKQLNDIEEFAQMGITLENKGALYFYWKGK